MTPTIKKFGAYEILHELKSGGMGSVLLGRKRSRGTFEQLVAIKTIRPEYASAENVRKMFEDEAGILSRLGHPGVANVHDFGDEGGTLYMVMEYVAGIPFRDFTDQRRMPPTIVARAIAEACRGLHAAHELRDLHGNAFGLVHRDISPDNLMLGFDGHVKVIDFGIALVRNRSAPVTEFGTVKGKPPYMSPEQVKNEPIDRRSDVFSLGVVMWEMLTGELLFDGDSLFAVAYAVDSKEIVPPSQVAGALPLGLDAVVMGALDRRLDTRTPSAAALAEALEAVVSAAGEESLESWADRELRTLREDHRTWLAGVVGGVELPKAIGRPSGSVTQLAADPNAPPALAATPMQEPAKGPELSTHVEPDAGMSVPPRRRIGIAIGAAVLLALIAGLVLLVVRPRGEGNAVVADAAATKKIDAPLQLDAVATVPPPVDAPAPIDIDAAVTVPHDAGRVTIHADARVVSPRPDAMVAATTPDAAPQPQGNGKLTVVSKGTYSTVVIDGGLAEPTPIINRTVKAGTHTITFVPPQGGGDAKMKTVVVHDGESVRVEP